MRKLALAGGSSGIHASMAAAAIINRLPRSIRSVQANASPNEILAQIQSEVRAMNERHGARISEIEASLIEHASARSALMLNGADGGGPVNAAAARREREALGSFVKSGDMSALSGLSPKAAMSTDSNPDGGYTVLPNMANEIRQRVFDISPVGRLARYYPLATGNSFEEPFDMDEVGAEWVGETQSRPALDTAQLAMFEVVLHEIYTSQHVTQRLLDDSNYNIGAWLEGKIATKFAIKEGAAFVSGDGVLKPRGLLTYPTDLASDKTRARDKIQHIVTGASGAFASSNPADALLNVVYSLRAPYRPNARWLMNLATAGVVRKFKDGQGNYLWTDSVVTGQPATFAGFPVELDEEMPDIAANAFPVAFGDFRQAYTVVDRPGMKLLRDPFTAKPHVVFYAYRRVGGGVHNKEAIKLLKVAA